MYALFIFTLSNSFLNNNLPPDLSDTNNKMLLLPLLIIMMSKFEYFTSNFIYSIQFKTQDIFIFFVNF
jgi:hypothetical protein